MDIKDAATANERELCRADPWRYYDGLAGHYADADDDDSPSPDDDLETRDCRRKAVADWLVLCGLDEAPYALSGWIRRDRLANTAAFDAALTAIADENSRGLFLWGDSGTGKTIAACAAVAAWMLVHRHSRRFHGSIFERYTDEVRQDVALWIDGDVFKVRATAAARTPSAWCEMRDELSRAPVLVLDDMNHTATDTAGEMLLSVMRHRLDRGLGCRTIITSNFSASEIARRNRALGAVVRRWRETLTPIAFGKAP